VLPANEVYYYEVGEGRWNGKFSFRVDEWRGFFAANLGLQDRLLGVLLHVVGLLPGDAIMYGEIACDPHEGDSGVARVDVSVERFGLEIYRLRGHYALVDDGVGVGIRIYQRFGPYGSPLENEKDATAEILEGGYLGVYYMKILGEDWVGKYRLNPNHRRLEAEYKCEWGTTIEIMDRQVAVKPETRRERLRYETLLDVARELEALDRIYEDDDDGRALFTYAYGVVTRTIAFELTQTAFDDPDWVVAVARAFAWRYIAATEAYDRGDAPPGWARVFDVLRERRLSGVAEIVLCILAHILYDLPFVLMEVGLVDHRGVPRTADYHLMNDVLCSSIEPLQQRLAARYSPVFLVLDKIGSDFDELLSRAGVTHIRALAWYSAQRLADGARRAEVMAELEGQIDDVIDTILGRDFPTRLTMRVVHRSLRLLRRRPKYPNMRNFVHADRPQRTQRAPDREEDLLYGIHTAVGLKRKGVDAPTLRREVLDAAEHTPLSRALNDVALRLASVRDWERAKTVAKSSQDFAWRLGALLPQLSSNDGVPFDVDALGLDDAWSNAVKHLQAALQDGLRDGFDSVSDAIESAVGALDAVGVPASATLGGFDDLRASYDPLTDTFVAEVPALIRVPFDDIKWLIEPQNWARLIPHMLRSDWVEGPHADRSGILYEVVNVYHPFVDRHPLVMVNELAVEQHDTPDERVVKYRLHKAIEGALLVDEGTISLKRMPANASLLLTKKTLKVDGGRNPVLYALLRTNPDGLAYLFTYWVNTVARRFGGPNGAPSA
jgi:hypothetical protein